MNLPQGVGLEHGTGGRCQKYMSQPRSLFTTLYIAPFISQQSRILSSYFMALDNRKGRKICRKPFKSIPSTLSSPRRFRTIINTPRLVNLLRNAISTAGILPRIELFKIDKINKRTGYRILKKEILYRSERIYNRDRKSLLTLYKRDAIETVEDSAFRFTASFYYIITKIINLVGGSERVI